MDRVHTTRGDLTICWGPTSVFFWVWLATSAGRAMAAGRTAVGALKAARAKGRRKRAFMLGGVEGRVTRRRAGAVNGVRVGVACRRQKLSSRLAWRAPTLRVTCAEPWHPHPHYSTDETLPLFCLGPYSTNTTPLHCIPQETHIAQRWQ